VGGRCGGVGGDAAGPSAGAGRCREVGRGLRSRGRERKFLSFGVEARAGPWAAAAVGHERAIEVPPSLSGEVGPVGRGGAGEARAARPRGCRAMTYGHAAAGRRAPLGVPRADGRAPAGRRDARSPWGWPGGR